MFSVVNLHSACFTGTNICKPSPYKICKKALKVLKKFWIWTPKKGMQISDFLICIRTYDIALANPTNTQALLWRSAAGLQHGRLSGTGERGLAAGQRKLAPGQHASHHHLQSWIQPPPQSTLYRTGRTRQRRLKIHKKIQIFNLSIGSLTH
jgi:hypothetical protein